MKQTRSNQHRHLLSDKRATLLVFVSYKDGTHFNGAVKGIDGVKQVIKTHIKTLGLEAEDAALDRIELWGRGLNVKKTYSDIWIAFSDESWATITYEPKTQDIFLIPKTWAQEKRNEGLMPNGEPRWVRVYDYYASRHERDASARYRYTIVFCGMYRSNQKRRGEKQSGYYSGRISEDASYYEIFETEEIVDYLYGPFVSVAVGKSARGLGKRITYADLPLAVKRRVLQTYVELWDITDKPVPQKTPSKRLEFVKRRTERWKKSKEGQK